ncbi:hypothetical protein G9464_10955 [Halostella sp. JP-L12]|uniref:hypothetical protein n=1 Tax=Halostella TaxID=1843185 RepID=UPI0013CEB4B1|nr:MULTISPECIES: hypothetical protein [Halostella]NHN48115.1 hypothetical protein [Halostella sp. JP-L12]
MSDDRAASGEAPSKDGGERGVVRRLFRSGRANAALAWAVVGVLTLAFVESALDFDRQWMAFVAGIVAVVLIPAAAYGEWRVMPPWELLVVVAVPVIGRALYAGDVGAFASYFAVAGLALIVTVELHAFTDLEVTHWFAIALVVLTTMASAAAWTVVRWNLDRVLGTSYLSTNEALMTEWLWVTAAGFAAGLLFDVYFTRRDRELWAAVGEVID